MGKSQTTKSEIYAAFTNLVKQQGTGDISVTSIVAECSLSRRAFYYHFENLDDLIAWGFRHDIAAHLTTLAPQNPRATLLCPSANDKYANMPCYSHEVTGVRTVNGSMFFKALHDVVDDQNPYYPLIVRSAASRTFMNYIETLYLPLVRADIKIISGGRPLGVYVPDILASDFIRKQILAGFYPLGRHKIPFPEKYKGLENIAHDALKLEVNQYLQANSKHYVIRDLRPRA